MPDYWGNMKMNFIGLGFVLYMISSTLALAGDGFPISPDQRLTPGSLCHSKTYRYPEKIPYCARNVSSGKKRQIIATYDQVLHYGVGNMPRSLFKIDHYIPLCMGGSNEESNLWPQHESVYRITDVLEPLLCDKMAQGQMSQREAVELIRRAKADLSEVAKIVDQLKARGIYLDW